MEKLGGRYVYFSLDRHICDRQKQKRLARIETVTLPKLPSNAQAVLILVELIRQPEITIEQLARYLQYEGHLVDADGIFRLLSHHGLLKKTEPGAL